MLVPGKADVLAGIKGVAERNVNLQLLRGIGVERSIVSMGSGGAYLLTTNFKNEP